MVSTDDMVTEDTTAAVAPVPVTVIDVMTAVRPVGGITFIVTVAPDVLVLDWHHISANAGALKLYCGVPIIGYSF